MASCFTGPPKIPTFNITCNIWFGATVAPPGGPPNLALVPCQLTPGECVFAAGPVGRVYLRLPPLTNIHWNRTLAPFAGPDTVEVPAGSAHWYQVVYVNDVGKGFPNENRFALLVDQIPTPDPLP